VQLPVPTAEALQPAGEPLGRHRHQTGADVHARQAPGSREAVGLRR
jgi:hypothetical protein